MENHAKYQTIGPRIIAAIADSFVLLPLVAIYWAAETPGVPVPVLILLYVLLAAVSHAYNIYLHGRYGQTLGKMFAKVKVVTVDNSPISFYQAYLRDIPYLILAVVSLTADITRTITAGGHVPVSEFGTDTMMDSITVLMLIVVGADVLVTLAHPQRRSLHDLIAGTVVVRTNV